MGAIQRRLTWLMLKDDPTKEMLRLATAKTDLGNKRTTARAPLRQHQQALTAVSAA